jgi:hypothetical protein
MPSMSPTHSMGSVTGWTRVQSGFEFDDVIWSQCPLRQSPVVTVLVGALPDDCGAMHSKNSGVGRFP